MARALTLVALFVITVGGARAFSVSPLPHSCHRVATPSPSTALFGLLTEEETKAIFDRSIECAEGECSVDDVAGLLEDLKEQKQVLEARLKEITTMVNDLTQVNMARDRPVDEVRETVRAIARLFLMGDKASGNDYPKLSKPTGWTGDVGAGAKTAWDVLPPKKWKKPKAP